MRNSDWSIRLLLAGLAAASALLVAVRMQYPPGDRIPGAAPGVLIAGVLLAGIAGVVWWRSARRVDAGTLADRRLGFATGGIGGVLWILEIAFNNFVDPRIATQSVRWYVDDGTWTLVGVIMLGAAVARGRIAGVAAGVRVGLWSGLVSGLLACLMAQLLILVWMPSLLADPLNIAEYRDRAAAGPMPPAAVFFAYETLTGAFAHLAVLGIIMGALLGTVGGVLGRLTRSGAAAG